MKLFNGHLQVTVKSLTVAIGAVIAVLVAFDVMSPAQAATLSAAVATFASFVVPQRKDSDINP